MSTHPSIEAPGGGPTPTHPSIEALLGDAEARADLRRRRRINRGLLGLALLGSLVVVGGLAWKVTTHVLATGWLRLQNYRVDWSIDAETRARGGSTRVKAGVHYAMLASRDPNEALKHVAWLHRVETLDLVMTSGLTDADLAVLGRLPDLELLNLDRAGRPEWVSDVPRLTDASLAAIGRLAKLRELDVAGQPFTDAGVANLAGLCRLQSLDLRQTRVTDAAFATIAALPALKSVDLRETGVTSRGVDAFEAAHPGVKVLSDPPPPTKSR